MAKFTINSETNKTVSSIKDLYNFLSDFKNFGTILPEDKVQDFKYSENECSFTIKGITEMTIIVEEKVTNDFILFSSNGLAKFNFSLKVQFMGDAEAPGECKIDLLGDLNPFIKAMAEKPLGNLVNTMSLKLSQLTL
ncbi:hypothetical protein [Aurantibacillus circumpalustris]|uniref:hypothetical protein n=1 Tax=Aurantibacillus circumpalustris TaxID=3036359 RepID=UPI00295AC808|nr:hypothetical protein [Aurantibacillus circumpalustris]